MGGRDQQCPIYGDDLVQLFRDPPSQVRYEDFSHEDFVKSKHLARLVSDIEKSLEARATQRVDKQLTDLFGTTDL